MSSTGLVEALVRDVRSLAGEDFAALKAADLRDCLSDLLGAVDQLQAQVTRAVDAFDARGLCVDDGCRSTRSWLRSFGRLSEFGAGEQVRGARVLRDLPGLARASNDGELSAEHLRQVVRLVRRVGAGPVAHAEPVLVEAATRLDPTDFGRVCARVRAHVDPDGELPDAAEDFARREIVLSPCDGMVLVNGRLDPEGGAALVTALDALMPPPGDGDVRSARQRRADALVELARGALTNGRLPVVGGMRPQVGVLVTAEQLIGRTTATDAPDGQSLVGQVLADQADAPDQADEADQADEVDQADAPDQRVQAEQSLAGQAQARQSLVRREAVRLPAAVAALCEAGPPGMAWLEWVGEVPTSVAQRIVCDADVWRIVLDPATGRPVDVGRSYRLVPVWIRKALYARDRGCRFPGCRAPAAWTDGHHLRPWARGGHTDIDNLILLCRFHHGLVHEGRWTIRLDADTGQVSARRPDGRPYEIHDHRTATATGRAAPRAATGRAARASAGRAA